MRLGLISKRDHKINNYITVHIPTLGEIFDFGQSEYMSIVSSLVATPYEAMVMLDDTVDASKISKEDLTWI